MMLKVASLFTTVCILLLLVEPSTASHRRSRGENLGRNGIHEVTTTTTTGPEEVRTLMKDDKNAKNDDMNQVVEANNNPNQEKQPDQVGSSSSSSTPPPPTDAVATNDNQASSSSTNQDKNQNQDQAGSSIPPPATTTTTHEATSDSAAANDNQSNTGGAGLVGGEGPAMTATTESSTSSLQPSTTNAETKKSCCKEGFCHTHKVPCLGKLYAPAANIRGLPQTNSNALPQTFCVNSQQTSTNPQLTICTSAAFSTPPVLFSPMPIVPPQVATITGYSYLSAIPSYSIPQPITYKQASVYSSINVKTESGSLFLRGDNPSTTCVNYAFVFQDRPTGYDYRYDYPSFLDGKCCTYLAVIGGTGSFRLATGSVRACWNFDLYNKGNDVFIPLNYFDFEGVCGCEENECCPSSSTAY